MNHQMHHILIVHLYCDNWQGLLIIASKLFDVAFQEAIRVLKI